MSQPTGQIVQIAYVVPDLEKALDHWVKKKITGPFHVLKSPHFDDTLYKGESTVVDLDVALCFSGNMCVELIQQNTENPSVYKKLSDNGGGFHHWGVSTENFEADVAHYEEQGYELGFYGVLAGTRFAYFDTTAEMGGMIELIEKTPSYIETFGLFEDAARDWDGNDPIRYLDMG